VQSIWRVNCCSDLQPDKVFSSAEVEFCAIHGMGLAKYVQLQAVLEMSRRALQEELQRGDALGSPRVVRDYLQLLLGARQQEVFLVLFLDTQHRVIAFEELFHGTLGQTSVYPREVVKRALSHNAAAVILAHNHPSGVAEPSQSDRLLTDALKQALLCRRPRAGSFRRRDRSDIVVCRTGADMTECRSREFPRLEGVLLCNGKGVAFKCKKLSGD